MYMNEYNIACVVFDLVCDYYAAKQEYFEDARNYPNSRHTIAEQKYLQAKEKLYFLCNGTKYDGYTIMDNICSIIRTSLKHNMSNRGVIRILTQFFYSIG